MQKLLYTTIHITTIFIFFAFTSLTQARNLPHNKESFSRKNADFGITHELSGQKLSVYIDQNSVLKHLPKLQKSGYVDPTLNKTEARFFLPSFAASVSIRFVTNIVRDIYMNSPDIDQIHVDAYLFAPDPYGNRNKTLCYSFNFNRKLYQKVNWKQFQPNEIKQIAPEFKKSDICENLIDTNPASSRANGEP